MENPGVKFLFAFLHFSRFYKWKSFFLPVKLLWNQLSRISTTNNFLYESIQYMCINPTRDTEVCMSTVEQILHELLQVPFGILA